MKHLLGFTQKHAFKGKSDFAILAKDKDDKKTPQIRSEKNFPDHQIVYMSDYMEFENDWAFSDFNKFSNSRIIKGSMRLGANYDIKDCLKQVAVHLQTDAKLNL